MVLETIGQKLHRAGAAATLIARHAADNATRRALAGIYARLSDRTAYDEEVTLNLRVNGRVFPFVMRLSDIFILAEILHERQYALQSPIPRDGVIVDAGGNVGASMVWFLAQCPEAKMHVFEPSADNLRFLERNAAAWPDVRVVKAALGREAGTVELYHGEFGGMHSVLENPDVDTAMHESVPAVTLADYMDEQGIARIDLLKLDIEGAELDALRGLGARIADVHVIVGEVHERIIDPAEFYGVLDAAGFRILWKKSFREGAQQGVHGFEAARDD